MTGSVELDAGSIQSVDPRQPAAATAAAPARRQASNWLLTAHQRSASGNTLAVMGPQLGYYYPEIVQQIDLHGPGINAQGVAVPGLAMYILIGRTQDYAWSLTSAGHDVRDVYAERLCEPDGSAPTRASTHYEYKGTCRAFEDFNAGALNGRPVRYKVSVHGPVFATATVGGRPYALARRRSTFGRDGLNLAALKDMTESEATTPHRFWQVANKFGFTFNWAYVSRKFTSFFSSGLLPRRPRGLDRRLPTLGDGSYEWTGFLGERRAPARHERPRRAAAELEQPLGPRLHAWRRRAIRIGAPCRAVRQVAAARAAHRQRRDHEPRGDRGRALARLAGGQPGAANRPGAERARPQVVDILDDWVARDAPRLDADEDGLYDEAGPAIMDAAWRPIAEAVDEAGVRRPCLRPERRPRPRRALRRVVRGQGSSARCWATGSATASTSPIAAAALWRSAGLRSGPRSTRPRTDSRPSWGRTTPRSWIKRGGAHGLRPRAPPEHVPDHEPADLPAGARATAETPLMKRLAVCLVAALGLLGAGSAAARPPSPSVDLSAADRCDFIGPQQGSRCLLPFPDDYYTVADRSTPTGRRVNLRTASMPANRLGVHIDASPYNASDGFSPGQTIVLKVPGLDTKAALDRTGAVPINHIGRYRDADQPIVVIDADTGRRWPIWAEIDSNATAPRPPASSSTRRRTSPRATATSSPCET